MNSRWTFQKCRSLPAWVSLALTVALLAVVGGLTVAAAISDPARVEGGVPLRLDGNYGGNFRLALAEPASLDPIDVAWEESHAHIVGQIFDGLSGWDDNLTPGPAVALSWESSDAQSWTFYLRPDAQFHNGRQIVAQDVVFSWERIADAGNEWYDYMLGPLSPTVTAAGEDTVQIALNEPFATLPSLLAYPAMSVVASETVGTILDNPVGSGAFQFQSWTAGDSIVLTYYDGYYAGRPYLDSITYQFYAGETEMYDDYLLGNLDLSPVPSEHITDVVGGPNAIPFGQAWLYYLGMKVDMPPLDDARVRQALNHAVDKQDLLDNVVPGYNLLAEGPVPPGMESYDPPVPAYAHNPTQTLDLLAQAGWSDTNFDGILDDGAGTDLTIELWYSTRLPVEEPIANAVADDLRDIGGTGLGATVVVDFTEWLTYRNNLDQYPMYFLRWGADYPDPYNFLAPHFGTGGVANYTNYSDPQVDGWLDQSLATLDLTARQQLYENIEMQVQESAPLVNLYYAGAVYIKSDDVLGLVIPTLGVGAIRMEDVQLFFSSHDMEPQAILYPKSSVLVGPITPTVKVRNAGSSVETNVPVRCRILEGSTELYNQELPIASLSPFATHILAFPAWTPPTAGDYTFEFTTLLTGDENPANDQETLVVGVTDVAFYDAYTRDSSADYGSVPTTQWWQSPDILVRNKDDNVRRHQDPVLGQTNYAYVQVRNIGNDTISDGYVNVYWHEPSAAVICGDWALINPTPIAVGTLAPGQSKWVETPWAPTSEGHTCLFTRFWSGNDPVAFECDVPWDNNIAQRNVEVVPLEEGSLFGAMQTGQATALFEVTNIRALPAPVDLVVERGTFTTTGTLILEFSHDLFSRWQDAGGMVEGGAAISGTSQIEITDPISGTVIGLPMGVRETQQVRIHLSGPPAADFELSISERIEGTLVGGMTYRTELPWMIYLPLVAGGTVQEPEDPPPHEDPPGWDPRLNDLGVYLEPANPAPGQGYWRLDGALWADEQESAGLHHIFIDVEDQVGNRVVGQPVVVEWSSGSLTLLIENRPPPEWGTDFAMYNTLGSYAVRVDGGAPSDRIAGLGLGTPEHPDWTIHTSFYLLFRWEDG